ncbi:hypothetical protein Tco_1357839 [Tanacetum coccineum]
MDAPLSPDHVFDFFVAEPVHGLAEAPGNLNRWIEYDIPLGGEMDEPMVDPGFDEEEMDDDDDDVLDEDDEWLMALVTPLRATVTVPSTYEVGGPSSAMPVGHTLVFMAPRVTTQPQVIDDWYIRIGNLEYRHGVLMRKMEAAGDAEVADSIAIKEIHPRVATVEGQVHGMASQVVHVVSKLEEMETRVQQRVEWTFIRVVRRQC